MKVRFVASASRIGLSGGGRVRSFWPAETLAEIGWDAEASKQWPKPADVIVIHRPLAGSVLPMLHRYHREGCKVVVDHDDEIESVPKSNSWQPNPSLLRRHRETLDAADAVFVSSERLQYLYGGTLVPNYLPEWISWERFPGVNDGRVRVGWAGLIRTHRTDLEWLAPHPSEAFRGALFTTVGSGRTPTVLGLEGETEVFPAVGIPEKFYRAMARADIGIVPLDNEENRDFNTSKSWLKAAEYIALGKPVVATDLPEQRKLLRGTGAGFLASTSREMAEQIQALVHDSALREQMTQAARRLAKTLTLEQHIEEWVIPIRAVLGAVHV